MQVKCFTLLVGLLFLTGSSLMAQTGSNPNPNPSPTPAPGLPKTTSTTTTLNCPTNDPGCIGDCIFTVTVSSQAGDSCEDNRVDVTFSANSTGTNCVADYDRASSGEITFTLCDGETCSLDEDNFPDDSFWPPYVHGDSIPAGKDSITQACRDAISIGGRPPGPPYSLFYYRFIGVSTVDPDFGIRALCYCSGDTIIDTITVEVDTVSAQVVDRSNSGSETGGGSGDVTGGNGKWNGGPFAEASTFVVSNVYPNPASDELNVVFQAFEASHVTVLVHDQLGKRVRETIQMLDVGDNLFTLDVTTLKQGFYYMTLIGPYDEKVVMKFVHR